MSEAESLADALPLITMPFTFTQDKLWNTERLIRAARDRGHRIDLDTLQALHQERLLLPLFRVDDVPDPAARLDVEPNGNLDDRRQAQYAAADGRLRDPDRETYAGQWPYRRPSEERGTRRWWNGFLYSSWQLLDLHVILGAQCLRVDGLKGLSSDQLVRQRRRVLALAALAPRYLPGVLSRLRVPPLVDEHALRRFRFESDPAELLRRVGYSAADLRVDAENLLHDASGRDPLQHWLPLVRHANVRVWEQLRGDALDCLWQRIAAEVLLRAHEDLAAVLALEPLPDVAALRGPHPLHERLSRTAPDASSLEQALVRFGLSPHPRVLLLVEGDTELDHFPKLLEAFGLNRPELVRVQNAHGSGQNPQLLARYAVTPRIGPREVDSWPLLAAPTALVIAMDPENRWAPDRYAEEKLKLQKAIQEEVKAQGGEVGQNELDTLVNVHVWGDQKYELANFTDNELLSALTGLASGRDDDDRGTPAWLARKASALQAVRARRADIDAVIGPMRVGKPRLASALWPTLLAKIERELELNDISTPALRVVLDVERLVDLLAAGGYVLIGPSVDDDPGT